MSGPLTISSGQLRVLAALLCTGPLATDALTAKPPTKGYQLRQETKDRCVSILTEAIHAEDFGPAIHAAEALTRAGLADEVTGPFTERLANETDDRRKCVWSRELVRAGDASKARVLLQILTQPDPYAHIQAAEGLYKAGHVGDGEALRSAMASGPDPILRIMAAGALAKHGDGDAMRILRERVADADLESARIAAWVLGRIGDSSDIPDLRNGASRSRDDLTRCYFEHSLATLGDAEGRKALERNLTHEDMKIRAYAITFAGDAQAVELAPKLIPLLDDPVLDVRVRACQTLLVWDKSSRE
jgi:sialidase-1